jgi:hypothetical protein
MSNLTELIAAIAILVGQTFLSKREHAYWGALLPIVYIVFLVYGQMSGLFKHGSDQELFYIGLFGTVILLSIWISGRKVVSTKRQKEMEKIEVQNI